MKYKMNALFDEEILNVIKEAVGEEAYNKLVELEIDSAKSQMIPKVKFDEMLESNKTLKAQIEESSKQIADLSAFKGTNEELAKKIDELNEAQKVLVENHAKEMTAYKTGVAKSRALEATKARNAKALSGMIDWELVTYDEANDTLKGFEEQVAQIKKDNAWLFEEAVAQSGGYNGGQTSQTSVDQDADLRAAFGLPTGK